MHFRSSAVKRPGSDPQRTEKTETEKDGDREENQKP